MPSKNEIAATLTKAEALKSGVLTADQAVENVTANSRKLYGFTRKLIPRNLPTEPKQYIYSVSEYGSRIVDGQSDGTGIVNLGPGFQKFEVMACPEGEDYGEPCIVDPIYFFEEAKVDVTEHTFHSGEQMADAILQIGPGMAAAQDRRPWGWFVSKTNPPKDAEVDRAVQIYTQTCQRLIREADSHHSRNQLLEINETHRRAAQYLRQTKKPWYSVEYKMVDCPGCGEAVRDGVIWHATPHGCGYIFDQEGFKKNFRSAAVPVQHQDQQPSAQK